MEEFGIIRVKNTSYSRYEELLIRRDNLLKEAFIWQREYVAEFGDLILKVFEKKLDCIRKKKTIEFCQRALNYGKAVDQELLQAFLAEEMAAFQAQLDAMIDDNNAAKMRETVSEMDLLKIKKIYHKLVKMIHPDINPLTNETPALLELWERVQIAYKCNKLPDMEEAEVLVVAALEQLGIGNMEIEIPDIEDKIAEVEAEILKIRETEPYTYQYLLNDAEAVEEKKKSLEEELISFEEYGQQLDEILEGIMASGVKIKWDMN